MSEAAAVDLDFALTDDVDRIAAECDRAIQDINRGRPPKKILARLQEKIAAFLGPDRSAPSAAFEAWTLGELQLHPELLKPPAAIIPWLAWPERVSLLSAREKRGKTTLIAHGAAALSQGAPFLGESTQAARVLWVFYEGHVGDVARTLTAAGAHSESVILMRGRPGEWAPLVAAIEKYQPALVVIDTLASFAAGTLVKEFSRAEQWTPVMNMFSRLAQSHHAAFIVIHHDKKSGGYADSRAIGAGVDMLLNMPGEPGDPSPRRQLTGVGRWPYSPCTITIDSGRYVIEGMGATPVELEVLSYVRQHPGCSKRAVRDALGRRKDDADSAITKLIAENFIENRGGSTGHKYHALERGPNDEMGHAPATLPATLNESVAGFGGQRLTPSPADSVARSGHPVGVATATPARANGGASQTYPCAGGCGVRFSAPGLKCNTCRSRPPAT